jgi:hypothetical protein
VSQCLADQSMVGQLVEVLKLWAGESVQSQRLS